MVDYRRREARLAASHGASALTMSRADWELIQTRRAQALADRLESEALTAALEAGQDTLDRPARVRACVALAPGRDQDRTP